MKIVMSSAAAAALLCGASAVWAQATDQAAAPAPVATAAPAQAAPAVPTPVAAVAPTPPEAAPPACELHIFPTLEGQAMTSTMLSGFGIIGAIADAAANKDRNVSETEYLKEALGPRLQIQALKSVNVVDSLHLPPSQIIYETPIADRDITTKATNRLSSSTASCYYELIVTQNLYAKRPMYGRSLNNRFIFKDFHNGQSKAKLIKGRGGNGLSKFPPKTTDETEAAETDLREAFAKNFEEFAKGMGASKAS